MNNSKNNYVDFHTHLDWYANSDELLNQLQNFKGILVSASVDCLSYEKNLKLVEKAKALGYLKSTDSELLIVPTVGVHPEKVKDVPDSEKELSKIYNPLLQNSLLIGEIGMDFFWCKDSPSLKQEKVFRFFLEHCNQTGKYCVIHTKGAEVEICKILAEYPNIKPVIHWYDGPEDVYKEFVYRGYMQTFGCETCRSEHIKKFLEITPKELILAETDNPTGEPWLGGTDNSLNLIKRVYDDIAQAINMDREECRQMINNNANRILGI